MAQNSKAQLKIEVIKNDERNLIWVGSHLLWETYKADAMTFLNYQGEDLDAVLEAGKNLKYEDFPRVVERDNHPIFATKWDLKSAEFEKLLETLTYTASGLAKTFSEMKVKGYTRAELLPYE